MTVPATPSPAHRGRVVQRSVPTLGAAVPPVQVVPTCTDETCRFHVGSSHYGRNPTAPRFHYDVNGQPVRLPRVAEMVAVRCETHARTWSRTKMDDGEISFAETTPLKGKAAAKAFMDDAFKGFSRRIRNPKMWAMAVGVAFMLGCISAIIWQ